MICFASPRLLQRGAPAVTRSLVCALLFLGALACFAQPVAAHPHAWIDLRSTVLLDENGHVIAIEQEWLFDDFYTLFVTEHIESAGESPKAALNELAKSNLGSLSAYDYFTEVEVDGSRISLGTVTEYESELRNGRLWLRFVLPLAEPLDAVARDFSFAVFDPTYYVEVLHLEGEVISFRGPGGNACSGMIVPPTPTVEMVMLAQALDRGAKPDNTLGSVFAERVEVACHE